MKKHNLALTLFTVASSPLPYPEKLKKAREIGYQSIQGGLPPDGMSLKDQKALLDSLEMEICVFSGAAQAVFENDTVSAAKLIEGCHFHGCDEIMIGSLPFEYRESYDTYMKGIEILNKGAQIFKKEGIFISYHNHAQEFRKFSNGKRGMDLFYENLDYSCMRFLLDTHWLQSGGVDILEWMEKCKGKMKYLHVKDYRIAPANYDTPIGMVDKQFSQVGDGQLPWDLIIKKGLELGIQAFIVEQDKVYDEDCWDCAAQSYKTLKSHGLK
ncbi:MAG: sugar phosphate isomerase/epimerase [Treponema sp.]|nr:sugar phosphate isomerase/epimerase [Treponema sp.]